MKSKSKIQALKEPRVLKTMRKNSVNGRNNGTAY